MRLNTPMNLRSSIEAMAFPALATGMAAELMALQRQLDTSQWWPPEKLRDAQFRQLRLLVTHAAAQIPFHAKRLKAAGINPAALTPETWSRLPTLTRQDLQTQGDALLARAVPKSHGALTAVTSGGSSGVPVRVRKTALDNLMWNAFHVREELWHRENPTATMARIRRVPPGVTPQQEAAIRSPAGLEVPDWGPPTNLLWQTGRVVLMDDRQPTADQVALLDRLRPGYLFTFPANLRLIMAHYREAARPAPQLQAVWTMSETVDADTRAACRAIFGCRIVDSYTSAEAGYMALQCPEQETHFHVQAEAMLLEVLDEAGHPCPPGQEGRVVITPLHNFATPLLRYEIGDMAELGQPCPCGRGLPVLQRIVGRTFDFLHLPNGQRRRVDSGFYGIAKIPAVREFQVAQRAADHIELRLVLSRPLGEDETTAIRTALARDFGPEFRVDIIPRENIPRTAAGKLKIFVSEMPSPP